MVEVVGLALAELVPLKLKDPWDIAGTIAKKEVSSKLFFNYKQGKLIFWNL